MAARRVAATLEVELQRGDSVLPCALLQAGVACLWPPRHWRGSLGFLLIRISVVSFVRITTTAGALSGDAAPQPPRDRSHSRSSRKRPHG